MGWLFNSLPQKELWKPHASMVPLCYRQAWQRKIFACNLFLLFRARVHRGPLERPFCHSTVVHTGPENGARFPAKCLAGYPCSIWHARRRAPSLGSFDCKNGRLLTRPKLGCRLLLLHGPAFAVPNLKSKRAVGFWI